MRTTELSGNGMGLAGMEHLQPAEPPTPEQIQRARRAVAALDATVEERAQLLKMLGIGPELEV